MRSLPGLLRRLPAVCVGGVALAAAFGACGGDSSNDSADGSNVPTEIPFADGDMARGEQLATDNGCLACHSVDDDRVGPKWGGLAGSEVQLDDGTTVTADREYLALAITDPGAQKVDGYPVAMPGNRLTSREVADVVAYLESLGTPADVATSAP